MLVRLQRFKLTPSLFVSLIALFVALGGGAYAAIGFHSIGSVQLKSGAVTKRVLRNDSVVQAKIRPGSVGAAQIRSQSVNASKVRGSLPGTLVAYAKVTAEGKVDPDESWRISDENVLQMPIANYCLRNLPAHRTAMVTPGFDGSGSVVANLSQSVPPESICDQVSGNPIQVSTTFAIEENLTAWKYEPFYVYLFK